MRPMWPWSSRASEASGTRSQGPFPRLGRSGALYKQKEPAHDKSPAHSGFDAGSSSDDGPSDGLRPATLDQHLQLGCGTPLAFAPVRGGRRHLSRAGLACASAGGRRHLVGPKNAGTHRPSAVGLLRKRASRPEGNFRPGGQGAAAQPAGRRRHLHRG